MSKKIYVITKDKYSGHQRKVGFFVFLKNDLYYDFGLINGSHNSFHKDGSQWRTNLITGEKAKKEGGHTPLADFTGVFNLGVAGISKNIIPKLPKVKQKYFNKKHITYEIDLDEYTSDQINIVSEIIEPGYTIPLTEEEKIYPLETEVKVFKETTPWLRLTIMDHDHNLLAKKNKTGVTVNHINDREEQVDLINEILRQQPDFKEGMDIIAIDLGNGEVQWSGDTTIPGAKAVYGRVLQEQLHKFQLV